MTVVSLLENTKILISDPSRWTTKVGARDSSGRTVTPNNPEAVCWCSSGALDRVSGKNLNIYTAANRLLSDLCVESYDIEAAILPLPYFNDTHTHLEVLAKFDEAIALAMKEAL